MRAASAPARAWWKHPALWVAVLAVLLYLPCLGYGYVRDDHELIRANPFLRRSGFLAQLLTSDFWRVSGRNSGMWRPLVVLSYWVDGRVFQWQAAGFHAVNLLVHAATSALVTVLALSGGVPWAAAVLAGAWFAAMPAHVESVAWISGRTDEMSALCFALALWLDRRRRRRGYAWPGWAAPTAMALALLSKETALPFVAIVAAAEWIEPPGGRFEARAALRWLAPYAAITLLFYIAHEALAARWLQPPYVDPATMTRIRWAGWIMLPHYVAMLWPWYPHSPDIALELPPGPSSPWVAAGIVITLALVVPGWVLLRRRSRAALPLALFLLPLLAYAALAWIKAYLTFAERLIYLPSIGAAWLLGLALAGARSRVMARSAYVAAAALVVASAIETVQRVPEWKDDITMFQAMTRVQPRNARARIGYANQLAAQGREREALDQLAEAERLEPALAETHASRAVIYYRHGDWSAVRASAARALELEPANPQAKLLEATALMRLRRLEDATRMLRQMMTDDPGDPAVEGIWGQVLLLQGDPAGALPYLKRAASWQTDDASVSYAQGMAAMLLQDWPQAAAAFDATVKIDPRYYEGWLQLATAAARAGDAATRDRALAEAAKLPEARDGRVQGLERELRSAPAPAGGRP